MCKVLLCIRGVVLAACLCSPWLPVLAEPTLEDVSRVLETRGISYDRQAAARASVLGFVRSIDPGAQILSPKETTPAEQEMLAVAPLMAEDWPGGIQYLAPTELDVERAAEATAALDRWGREGRRGVVVDLRKTTGSATRLVDRLAGGLIGATNVLYEVRDSTNGLISAHTAGDEAAKRIAETLPWVILVDRGTAGDAELLAAVLKHTPGVTLIGDRTRGEAAVRETLPLEGGYGLLLATGWRVPVSGVGYHSCGVVPDVPGTQRQTGKPDSKLPNLDSSGRALTATAKLGRELAQEAKRDPWKQQAVDVLLAVKALPGPWAQKPGAEEHDAAAD